MAESFLYSFNAKKVTAKKRGKGDYRLTFRADSVSNVSSFSQRPERETGYFTINQFERVFDSLFKGSRPNASLNFWDEGESQIVVHRIKSLNISRNSKVVINVVPLQVLGSSETLPRSIEEASFFVDSGNSGGTCSGSDVCNTCSSGVCVSF